MPYRSLRQCVDDLQRTGRLVRIDDEIDPRLEAAYIQRRVYAARGPALLLTRVRGCRFPLVANLFGTIERMRYLFRDTLASVERLVQLKVDPTRHIGKPWRYLRAVPAAWHMRPRYVSAGPVLACETTIGELPQIVGWPLDGGPFITLPQVYTEHPDAPGWRRSNLGMYRVQIAGNSYQSDVEVGLHYQIHRGIGVHHAAAIARGEPLRVCVNVGGPPAMAVAAVMPLPEGLSELSFAGALGGRRIRLAARPGSLPVHADADFCLIGTIDPQRQLPEGPFGDHLGYYAQQHDFPVLRVERVFHRSDAIWPFTSVGRPPQEDTTFGQFIHELTGPVVPTLVAGVHAIHAVDAAGVHPLLLALGSERYVPYAERVRPQELLTQANALLGQGQLSLAKYLFIAAREDEPTLDIHDVGAFFAHILQRVDWQRDLHFQTCTTIDTLDYSGTGLNEGSKLVVAAVGPPRRPLPTAVPQPLRLPPGFDDPRVAMPGVLAIRATHSAATAASFCDAVVERDPLNAFPLIAIVDDAEFTTRSLQNFLWVVFTRSDPARDVHGVGAFVENKHWGSRGALVIDARRKSHHALPLEDDPAVVRRVEQLASPGRSLHGLI